MSVAAIAEMVAGASIITKQYSGLFSVNTSFDFGSQLPTFTEAPQRYDYPNAAQFLREQDAYNAAQVAPRRKTAEDALNHFWAKGESTKEWYASKGVTLHTSPDTIQFVEYTQKGFVVHDEPRQRLTWLERYLARVHNAGTGLSSLSSGLFVPTVLFRPIILSPTVLAYYVCPVTLNTDPAAWATCGYKVSEYFFKPLDISSPNEFIGQLTDPKSGDFYVPYQVAGMEWQKISWFWAECGYAFGQPSAESSALPIPGSPAPPPLGVFNFEGYSGGINILTGAVGQGAGSLNIEAGSGKTAPATRSYYNEQPVSEPSDKLIAAIGTAAAAAITIGVASAVSG